MDKVAPLEPAEFAQVSPVVASILAEMLHGQSWLSLMPSVQVAVLSVTVRYEERLRVSEVALPPVLSQADHRRALLFLRNTVRPLHASPTLSAVDLFDTAMNEIASGGQRSRRRAAQAFEHGIAAIVHVARGVRRPALNRCNVWNSEA